MLRSKCNLDLFPHAGGEGSEEVVGASLWISTDFQWIWLDFLHVDLHLYLYYLQSISRIFQVNIVEACITECRIPFST